MKVLFSLFMIPAVLGVFLAGLGGIFIYLDGQGFRPAENPQLFWTDFYFFALHLSMAGSLILSIFGLLYSACMVLVGLILRAWAGVLLAAGLTFFSFLLLQYLMNTTI